MKKYAISAAWTETMILVTAGAAIITGMSFKSFSSPFFAENFQYVGQFEQAGHRWLKVLFLPTTDGWFKPLDKLSALVSFSTLPLNPLAFHLRNLFLTILVLILLYRLLFSFTARREARILAFLFFTVSKFHLSMIGYINLCNAILVAIFTLASMIFFYRYIQQKEILSGILGTTFAILAIYTKETAIVILPVVAALMIKAYTADITYRNKLGRLLVPIISVGLATILLFIARKITTGHFFSTFPDYSPTININIIKRNTIAYLSAISNTSLITPGLTGAGGLGWLLATVFPKFGYFIWIDYIFAFICPIGLILLVLLSRSTWIAYVVPISWGIATFTIYLSTRNLQLYYTNDFIIAVSLMMAVALDKSVPKLRWVVSVGVLFIFINGFISNYNSVYNWQYVSLKAAKVTRVVAAAEATSTINKIYFLTAERDFWTYTLGGSGKRSPMIPMLSHNADLVIAYFDYGGLPEKECESRKDVLCLAIGNDILKYPDDFQKPLILKSISTSIISIDNFHNINEINQYNQIALSISALNATPATIVIISGENAETTYGNSGYLTALIPLDRISKTGLYEIHLTDGIRTSNSYSLILAP